MNKGRKLAAFFVTLFICAYLINFFWESIHAVFLYSEHNFASLDYVRMALYASTMDALLILLIYSINSLAYRNAYWIEKINWINGTSFAVIGLMVALIIEYKAVFVFNQWQYNDSMPLIFGIGLSPLVQLSITGLISVWIASKLTCQQPVKY